MQQIFHEFSAGEASPMTNDSDSGLISGVKILGLTSRNGRVYPPEVLREAAPLYEGAKVNVNHVSKEAARLPRDYRDRIGTVSNVVFKENSGLFADFHYNPNHAQAKQLLWDAHNAPNNVGFSHCVEAVYHQENDMTIIDKIVRVISVDLVADPATTNGLFESEEAEGSELGVRSEEGGCVTARARERGYASENAREAARAVGQGYVSKPAFSALPTSNQEPTLSGGATHFHLGTDPVGASATQTSLATPDSDDSNSDSEDCNSEESTEAETESKTESADDRFNRLIESFEELKERLEQLCQTLENHSVTESAPLCPPSAWQQTAVKEETLEDFVRRLKNN